MEDIKPKDMGRSFSEQLIELTGLMSLPAPYNKPGSEPDLKLPKEAWKENYCTELDGFVANDKLTKPKTKEEKQELIKKFLSGLDKLFSGETNRGFLRPFVLSVEYCAKCNTCSEACHIYKASGDKEIYRPIFKSEVFRRLYQRHQKGKSLLGLFAGGDIEINIATIMRLGELAYRCNLCRRCAQACPLGIDNALITREIRALFSMEMGIAPSALHEKGTVLQLKAGSSTGINKDAFLDMVDFMEEDIGDRTGKHYKIPIDKKGADILLIHNAGEFVAWPENPEAFAILFEEAGLDWTMSSELIGYDCVNYGIWYDDVQAKRIALAQRKVARELGVRRIVIGECGHAHRAAAVSSDRMAIGEDNIPRESCFPILWKIVKSKVIKFDPSRNNFPVTVHDPCNIVRSMGIVKPQRQIIKAICPQFREMSPCGVNNYCCGGGGGFAIMKNQNFREWGSKVAGRMKFKQILEAFIDTIADPDTVKFVCAPCSNCKGAIRDILEYYQSTTKYNVHYGGIAELMVNAMRENRGPYFEFL
jgi:Fe-S oxidoreductase